MRSNNQKENQALTPMQKQAVLVCIVCALAALLTIGITLTMLKRGKNPTEQPGDSSIITPAPAPDLQRAAHRDRRCRQCLSGADPFYRRFQHGASVRQRSDLIAAVLRKRGHWHQRRPA